jgi:hypothetical protein
MLILIDAAHNDALAEMTRLIDLRPALATDDVAIELRRQLEEDNSPALAVLSASDCGDRL